MKAAPLRSFHLQSLLILTGLATGLFSLSAQASLVLETRLENRGDWPTGFLFLKVDGSQVQFDLWTQPGHESPTSFRIDSTDHFLTVHLNEGRTVRFDYDRFGSNPIPSNPFLPKPYFDGEPDWLPINEDDMGFDWDRLTQPALTLWVEQRGMINDPALAELFRNGNDLLASVDLIRIREIDAEIIVIRHLPGQGALNETSQMTAIPEPSTVGTLAGAVVMLVAFGSRRFAARRSRKTIA